MTISSVQNRVEYTATGDGTGVDTAYTVPFRFLQESDLVVVLRVNATLADTVQTLDTHYTVAGEGAASGGSITFIVEDDQPQTGETVVIYNDPPLTQTVDYRSGDAFPAETHEQALDLVTLQQKRTREITTRALLLPDSHTDGSGAYDAKLNKISQVAAPTATSDAATKNYVDSTVTNTVGPIPSGSTYATATGSTIARTINDRWGEVKNVKDFGAVGDATAGSMATGTDDTEAIQDAIDAASASGGVVLFPSGVYRVDSSLSIAASGVRIIGDAATINWTETVDSEVLFVFAQVATTAGTLSGAMSRGDNTITTGATITAGSLVSIHSGDYFYRTTGGTARNNRMGELLIPEEDDPAYLAVPALFSYANGHAISVITPNVRSCVQGLRIIGPGPEELTAAIRATGCVGFAVRECSIEQVNVGIQLFDSTRTEVVGNSFYSIDTIGSGYSVALNRNNYNTLIANNVADKVRHFVTTVGEDGVSRATLISGNKVSRSRIGAIDTHAQGYDTTISGNHISDSLMGITARGPRTTVIGNVLHNCHMYPYPSEYDGEGSKSSQHCIYTTELGYVNLVISGNVITMDDVIANNIGSTTLYGSGISVTGIDNDVTDVFTPEYIRILGNSIGKVGSVGGCSVNVTENVTEVQVCNNVIERAPYDAIHVEAPTGDPHGTVVVSGNILDGSDRNLYYAIEIIEAVNVWITGNTNKQAASLNRVISLNTVTDAYLENNSGMGGMEPTIASVTNLHDFDTPGRFQTLADEATPSVVGSLFTTGGTTTITDFDDGFTGQVITVLSEHAVTITDGTHIILHGSANFGMAASDSLTLVLKADNKWYELSRMVNAA